jgi:hypothetical protein
MATQEEMSRYFWSASTNCPPVGRLYIGRRNESARADRRVMRKKTGASTILQEIEENHDFKLFSSSGHFSQSFWC